MSTAEYVAQRLSTQVAAGDCAVAVAEKGRRAVDYYKTKEASQVADVGTTAASKVKNIEPSS